MRYSEAIRLGGMMAPKCKFDFFNPLTGGVCVQGAALQAVGALDTGKSGGALRGKVREIWPEVFNQTIESSDMPFSVLNWAGSDASIHGISVRLNDCTYWTREQIADWVATMEEKYGLIDEPQPEGVSDARHSNEALQAP